MSSAESRSLRTEMLLKRFPCTIDKFEKRLLDLKPREINHVRRPLPTKLNVTAVAADRLMKRKTKSSDKKEDCAVVVRRVAAKSCESNALPADNALLMRKRRNELEMERNNLKRREAIQNKREAARRELEQMRNTAGIYDPSELVRDLEKMLGYSITGHMPQAALPLPAYYKSLIKTDDMISCCDQDEKKVEEVEEGELID